LKKGIARFNTKNLIFAFANCICDASKNIYITMRTFGSFTFDVVEEIFEIKEVDSSLLLEEWTHVSANTDKDYQKMLTTLSRHLLKKANIWNEDELKMFFIGPLIEFAEMGNDIFQPFTQRSFSFLHNGEEIGGRVDFMIAKGRRLPKVPFFCIHEYKQETDNSGDPLGQLLIAMVGAQKLNEKEIPILGAYVMGRYWCFVVLEGNTYTKTNAYNASNDDIFQIFAILQKSKEIIQRFLY